MRSLVLHAGCHPRLANFESSLPCPPPQFRAGLLQQLSDLQLHQNDEKTATLRALLQSESLLDAAGGGMVAGEGLASRDSEDCCSH